VVNAKSGDPAAAVKKATGGGAHGVLITAPSLGAFKQGVGMTRKRGTCVLVGLPPGEFPVPLFDVVASCITIRGSFVGTRHDMAEALAFAAEGKVKADIEVQTLASINEIFARLQHGDVASRVVLEFARRSRPLFVSRQASRFRNRATEIARIPTPRTASAMSCWARSWTPAPLRRQPRMIST